MRIKVELDKDGNCSKHCPFIPQGATPIMVGGGLCACMCYHYEGYHRDIETNETYIECDYEKDKTL